MIRGIETIFQKLHSLPALALCALLSLGSVMLPGTARAADTPPAPLLSNGDFQADANGDDVPDGWAAVKGGAGYATEGTNRYLHLVSPKPDEMVLSYRQIRIPSRVKALELVWKQRTSDLQVGKQPWFDARIMLQWKDAAEQRVAGDPPPPHTNKNSNGWVERSLKFLVPENAVILEFMPALFQVKSGSYDLDDIVLKETDAAPVAAEAHARAIANAERLSKNAEKRQASAAAKAGPDGELIANGDFQTDAKSGDLPEKWGALKGDLSWQVEGDNRFLRLVSPEPGKMVMFYRTFDLPKDTKALEFKWKERLSHFKRGKENYFDARILLQWQDAAGKKMEGAPAPPASRKDTDGWVEKSKSFLVPDGALTLVLMPTLFQVEAGTYDLDELSLKAVDPAPLIAAAQAQAAEELAAIVPPEAPHPAKWPPELHVVGNKVLTTDGHEVWLRGVNVDSLQWNPRGERVLRSTLVAIEDWKSNVLRLPIKETYWFGQDPSQKDGGQAYRELVDDIVNLAANRGTYVMLDLHRFRAPKQAHVEFWKAVAAKYKNHPAVLFELFNEPHGTTWEVWRNGGFVEDKQAAADEDAFLTPAEKALNTRGFHAVGMQALVEAVRGTGAKNIVVAGGLDWAYDLSGVATGFALEERGGNGLMYAAHIYAQKTDWLGKVVVVADTHPVIVSEFGANTKKLGFMPAESQEDAATWVPRVLGFIQKQRFHWTAFSFHPGSAPVMISDWKYTPTPEWGALIKRALAGEQFPAPDKLR